MKNLHDQDILSLVTHDLKSPMTAIMGELDFLSLDNLTNKERTDSIKSAKKASKSMQRLIDSILTMAKLEAGKELIDIDKITNIHEHFNSIINTFKFEAKSKNITIDVNIEKNLPVVYWDIDRLHFHTFNNIISNALKFTYHNGNIKFKVMTKKDKVLIYIKDDGIGVPENEQKNIFKKFKTINNKKFIKGNGLGLYNANYFVEQHHGSIEVTKGLNNKGIGFLITLPVK